MRLPAGIERKILRLHAAGLDSVAIACELLIGWDVVERVLVDAEDDDETRPAAEGAGMPAPFGPSHQGSLLSDPGGSERPMRAAPPAQSQAKPEEVAATQAEATAVAEDAWIASVSEVDGPAADDAGSRASGGAGAAATHKQRARDPGEAQFGASPRRKVSRPRFDPLAESEAFVRRSPASVPQPRGVPGRAVLPEDLLSAGRPLALLRGRR